MGFKASAIATMKVNREHFERRKAYNVGKWMHHRSKNMVIRCIDDADFLRLRTIHRDKIFGAFGIPEFIMTNHGLDNYANMKGGESTDAKNNQDKT